MAFLCRCFRPAQAPAKADTLLDNDAEMYAFHARSLVPPSPPAPYLRVVAGSVAAVPEKLRVHVNQRVQRTWTVTNDKPHELGVTQLQLETPGLTVVRVRPELWEQQGLAARISVSSDTAAWPESVKVAIVESTALVVKLNVVDAATAASSRPAGPLVAVIELGRACLVSRIVASACRDVVVEPSVLTRGSDASVSMSACDSCRLFVSENGHDTLSVQEMQLRSESNGHIYFDTTDRVAARDRLTCSVEGDGSVRVSTSSVITARLSLAVPRGRGSVVIHARDSITTDELDAAVGRMGSIVLRSSPTRRFDVACAQQEVDVGGAEGVVDISAVASLVVRAKVRDGGRAIVRPHAQLEIDSDVNSIVECVGSLPPTVKQQTSFKVSSVVVTSLTAHASQPIQLRPAAPTIRSMFKVAKSIIR